jgi:adenylylsulfate kinase
MANSSSSRPGFVVWLTGLPCSGKSTISGWVSKAIRDTGRNIEILDGDIVRTNLTKGLGFEREDRDTNVRRVGFVANLLSRNGTAVICAVVSPYRSIRDELKANVTNLIEVFVDTPAEICAQRDVKGMWAKAKAGELKNFTGYDDPYEPPLKPHVHIKTQEETVDQSGQKVLDYLKAQGWL